MTGFAPLSQVVQVSDGATAAVTLALSPITSTHSEYVVVSQPAAHRGDQGVASATSVDGSHLQQLYGSLADDPIRVAHTLPHVTAIDDFRSEFTVRGSPLRHVDLVVDGVSTGWLQHTAYGRGATGSLSMLAGPVLQDVTLRAGAYPRRYGDRLGPQLELTVREGSRSDFALRGAVGGTNVLLLGEGPLGRSARGSWLVAARQSYLEWPTGRHESQRAAFGFSDGLAKLAYDVRPAQRVSLTVIHGMSSVDGEDTLAPGEMGDGANRASMVTVSWRSTFGSALVVSQRVSLVRQQFINRYQSDRNDSGVNGEVAYQLDITRPLGRGLLEGGAQLARTTIEDVRQSADTVTAAGSSSLRSGYLHYTWAATPTFTVAPGVRIARSTALPHSAVSPWLLGEWTFRPGWVLTGSAGMSQQLPALRHVLGTSGLLELRPERASHLDVAIERRLDSGFRWRATAFSRREDDILREPDRYPRLVDGRYAIPGPPRHANALEGTSHGIEMVAERRSRSGLSGWAAYAVRQNTLHGRRPPRDVLGRFRPAPRTESVRRVPVRQRQRGSDVPDGHQLSGSGIPERRGRPALRREHPQSGSAPALRPVGPPRRSPVSVLRAPADAVCGTAERAEPGQRGPGEWIGPSSHW